MTVTTAPRTGTEALAQFEAQSVIQPGTEGWWRVWGARTGDIRPGDIILSKQADGEATAEYVEDTFTAKSIARVGLVIDGERVTIGGLFPVIVVRWGTKNTLAF